MEKTFKRMLAAGLFTLAAGAAGAQEQPPIEMELNTLESIEGGCRAVWVINNGSEVGYETFRLDLVVFNPQGVYAKRFAAPMEPIRPGKTSVKPLDIRDITCADVSAILVNDVIACESGGAAVENCIDLMSATSRADAKFWK